MTGRSRLSFDLLRLALAMLLSIGAVFAQPRRPDSSPKPQDQTAVLRVTTHLVLVDVVATDALGRAVEGLGAHDFEIYENGKRQKIAFFSFEQSRKEPRKGLVPIPPQVYTNRLEYQASSGVPTVILFDALNTSLSDQVNARDQLAKAVNGEFSPGQLTAIYVLGDSIKMLQNFTDDPKLIGAALESFVPQRSHLLDLSDVEGNASPPPPYVERAPFANKAMAAGRANERKLLVLQEQIATRARVTSTLSALRLIAGNLAAIPGRKNLLWISASFPLVGLQIDRSDISGLNYETTVVKDLQVTANSLTEARVAVYPVDARGLTNLGVGAGNAGFRTMPQGAELATEVADSSTGVFETQASMMELAEETGGLAYYNRNDVGHSAMLAATDAPAYYVLGYYPDNRDMNGKFRAIRTESGRPGVRLRYRRGYYALKSGLLFTQPPSGDVSLAKALDPSSPVEREVVFDAAVLSRPGAEGKSKVEVRFRVDFNTLSPAGRGTEETNYRLEFHVVALTPDGNWVSQRDFSVVSHLAPRSFASIEKQGFPFHTELELDPGRYLLSLAVCDTQTSKLGSVRIPLILMDPTQGQIASDNHTD